MAEYYLISQLPSLDGLGDNVPVPITEERFQELCSRFLEKKALKELRKLSLKPPKKHEKSSSHLIEEWNKGERNLRFALGRIRADKMNKQFEADNTAVPVGMVQAARTAVEMDSPLEAEKFLNRYRLEFLESLRPLDTFSEESVFYYCLKLKLILRMRQFDADSGESAYRNIYNSIMNGDRLEVMQ